MNINNSIDALESNATQSNFSSAHHIAYIVTSSASARHLLRGQLKALDKHGYRVTLLCSPDNGAAKVAEREGVDYVAVPMVREIQLLDDLKGLLMMISALYKLKPDIVNASTPKGALLGIIAAWIARVPIRVYQLRGLRLETVQGKRLRLLRMCEKITAKLASHILTNSASLRKIYVQMALAPASKCELLGTGSGNGVNTDKYVPASPSVKNSARIQLGLPVKCSVIGYIGRLSNDKGICELVSAFERMQDKRAWLLLVGEYDAGDPIPDATVRAIEHNSQIVRTGLVLNTLSVTQAMDIHVFLSHREGLPNVVLECASCGVPTLARRATGTIDSISDGTTGWLISDTGPDSLALIIQALIDDPVMLTLAGKEARRWMLENWDRKVVWSRLIKWYEFLAE